MAGSSISFGSVCKAQAIEFLHEAALARNPRMSPLDDAEIPRIEAFGRKAPSPLVSSDRGGVIPIPTQDPSAARETARP